MYCVIVYYNPTNENLGKWEKVISKHLDIHFVIVDNSSAENAYPISKHCIYLSLHRNTGIAYAQNLGISYAMEHGAKYIVFFDQDSDVSESYFNSIVSEYRRIKSIVPNLAMLGPTIVNKETNANYKTKDVINPKGYVLTSMLISSGTIAEAETFNQIGMMDASLFIDGVDFEWCWRAVSKGLICARTQKVTLMHKVGQQYRHFLGYPVIVSSPIRYFYQYRNFFKLLRRSYVPRLWKVKTSIRRFIELFVVPFYAEKGWETFRQMLKGINAGVISK